MEEMRIWGGVFIFCENGVEHNFNIPQGCLLLFTLKIIKEKGKKEKERRDENKGELLVGASPTKTKERKEGDK